MMLLPGQSANYGGNPTRTKCMVVGPAPTDDSDEIWVHQVNGTPLPGDGRPKIRLMGWQEKRNANLRVGTITQTQVHGQTVDTPENGDLVTVMFWGYPGTEFATQWWWGWKDD